MNEDAGIYDDLIITKVKDGFSIVLNAACKNSDFEILKKRTETFTNRGIVFNGLTPEQLYKNRCILYEKYADYSVTNEDSIQDCIQKILSLLDLSLIHI